MHERSWLMKRNLFFLTKKKAQWAKCWLHKCGGWVQFFRTHRKLNKTACICDCSTPTVVWEAGDPSEGCTPVILLYTEANKGACVRVKVRTNLRPSLVSTCAPKNEHTHTFPCKHAPKHMYIIQHIYTNIKEICSFYRDFFLFLLIFKTVPILFIFIHFIKGYLINGMLNIFINI